RCAPGVDANIPHVADIEKAHAAAYGLVLGDQSSRRRILDRHVPAAKINHFCAQTAVQRIQRSLASFNDCGRVGGFHSDGSGQKSILACTFTRVKEAATSAKSTLPSCKIQASAGGSVGNSPHHGNARLAAHRMLRYSFPWRPPCPVLSFV